MEWLQKKFELSRGGSGHNVRPMEGLRGYAVFLVFLVHYVTLIKPWLAERSATAMLAEQIHAMGNTGVDLFFVLSGYLIYGSLIARSQPFAQFMSRRIKRIYPAFAAVFAVYVALSYALPAENKIPPAPLNSIIYLAQNFMLLPGIFPIEPMITVAWSLSYEMFYYLAIPLVIALFKLREQRPARRVAFFLTLAAGTVTYCFFFGGHVRLVMFISGILLYEAIDSRRIPTPSGLFGLSALVFGLSATLLPTVGPHGFILKICVLFVAFFILCLACFRAPTAWLPRFFSWTPLRWLGNMSYSYYLLHGLALKAGFLFLAKVLPVADYGAWMFCAFLPVMFILTLIPTTVLFLAVERPFSLAPGASAARKAKSSPESSTGETMVAGASQPAQRSRQIT